MIDKILEYKDELGSDTLKSLATFALDPKNIQQLKDNPKLVKTLTNNKLLLLLDYILETLQVLPIKLLKIFLVKVN
jgi:hypothetical protein